MLGDRGGETPSGSAVHWRLPAAQGLPLNPSFLVCHQLCILARCKCFINTSLYPESLQEWVLGPEQDSGPSRLGSRSGGLVQLSLPRG